MWVVGHDLAKEARPMVCAALRAGPGELSWFQLDLGTRFPFEDALPGVSISKELELWWLRLMSSGEPGPSGYPPRVLSNA